LIVLNICKYSRERNGLCERPDVDVVTLCPEKGQYKILFCEQLGIPY